MKKGGRGRFVVAGCVFVSLLLAVMPLPDLLDWLRPLFPLLVVLYWSMALPERYGTWTGWAVGLLLDVLRGTPLGMHALALALAGFAGGHISARMKVYPVPQQLVVVGLLAGVYLVCVRVVGNLAGITTMPLLPALLPLVTTGLLWPWTHAFLDRLRRAFGVN